MKRPQALAMLALAVGAVCTPLRAAQAEPAPDVLDWAAPEAHFTAAFRAFGWGADAVDLVDKRFGRSPTVHRMVEHLRAFESMGAKPLARVFGPGLILDRGVAVSGDDNALRLVVGADDAEAVQNRLVEISTALGEAAHRTADGAMLFGEVFHCALRAPFLVCDTTGMPPTAPPKGPRTSATAPVPTNGDLVIHIHPKVEPGGMGEAEPIEDLWVSVSRQGDTLEVTSDAVMSPLVRPSMMALTLDGPPPALLSLVDRRAGFLARMGVNLDNAATLASAASAGGADMPPDARALLDAARANLSGDLALTADGGVAHPVLLLGVKSPEAGEAFMGAVAAAAKAANAPVTLERETDWPGQHALVVTTGDVGGKTRFRLHYATVGSTLVLALAPADLARRIEGGIQPWPLPDALQARSLIGFVSHGAPGFAPTAWLSDVISADAVEDGLLAGIELMEILLALVDESSLTLVPRNDGWHATLRTRIL